jgi:hypothetical protein
MAKPGVRAVLRVERRLYSDWGTIKYDSISGKLADRAGGPGFLQLADAGVYAFPVSALSCKRSHTKPDTDAHRNPYVDT